jgi:hypothetical protein
MADAENWQKTYDNNNGIIEYVDTDTIKNNNNEITASLKREYGDGRSHKDTDINGVWFVYTESRSEVTIDCVANRITKHRLVNLSDDGTQQSKTKSHASERILNISSWDMAAREYLCAGVKGPDSVELPTLGIGEGTVMPQNYPNREIMPKESDIQAWYNKFQPGWYKIHEYQLDIRNDQPIKDTIITSEDCITPSMANMMGSAPVLQFALNKGCKMLQGELEETLFYGRGVCIDEQNNVTLKMAVVHLLEENKKVVSHIYALGNPDQEGDDPIVKQAVGTTAFWQGDCPKE